MTLILKQSKNEKGIFANRDLKKGELITIFQGKVLTYDDIKDSSYEDEHCIQIGKGLYIGPSGKLDDFINHSCSPNSGIKLINGQLKLVAINNINKGEEIRWDYSTSMNEKHWEMDCSCGSKNCRKRIRDFRCLPKKTQEKYLKLGIAPSYVLQDFEIKRHIQHDIEK